MLYGLLPFAYNESLSDPTQTSKFFIFSYTVLLLLCLSLLRFLFIPYRIFKINILDLIFLLLILYISLNRYFIQQDYIFSIKYYELLGLAIVYLILRHLNPDFYILLFTAIIAGGTLQGIYGILQLYGVYSSNHPLFKITGGFFNPGPYSGYLAVCFPVAAGIYMFRRTIRIHIRAISGIWSFESRKYESFLLRIMTEVIPLSFIIVSALVLPATQSRASWLAILLSLVVLALYKYPILKVIKTYLKTPIRIASAVIIVGIGILIAGYGLYNIKKGSSEGRLLIWKITMGMIADKPLIGFGYDNFKANYMDSQAKYFKTNPKAVSTNAAASLDYAFNEPLQFTSENGIIGLILVAIAICLVFKIKKSSGNPIFIIGITGIISALVFSFFSYPSEILPIKLVVILYIALIVSFYKENLISGLQEVKGVFYIPFKIIVIILAFFSLFYIHIKLQYFYNGFRNWNTAYSIYQTGSYSNSVSFYKKAYPVFNRDGEFLAQYGKALTMIQEYPNATAVLNRAMRYQNSQLVQCSLGDSYKGIANYSLAEKAYLNADYMCPSRFYPKYLLAKLYNETGRNKDAIRLANELLNKEVKIESKAIEEIKAEMKLIIKKQDLTLKGNNAW